MKTMHFAAFTNDFDMVQALISEGENINKPIGNGKTPLMLAVRGNCYETVELLLAHGANIDAMDDNRETALQMAFKSKETPPVIFKEFLQVARKQHPNTKKLVKKLYKAGCTLAHSIYLEDHEVMKGLLNLSVDVNSTGFEGETALHVAAERNQRLMVNHLLSVGANVNALDDYGYTALLNAATNSNSGIVSSLLDSGADPNVKSFKRGHTALFEAVVNWSDSDEEECGYVKCIELLILYDAVPSQKIGDDLTVFDEALMNGSTRRIDMLISYLALLEMQGDSMAKTMIQCKLYDNQYALPIFFKYFDECQRKLTTTIYESIALFDLLKSSERKFRSYMRNQQIRKIVSELVLSEDTGFFEACHVYRVLLNNRWEKVPSIELENAAITALGKIFCKTYNESYVFAREVVEYLSCDSLYNLSKI